MKIEQKMGLRLNENDSSEEEDQASEHYQQHIPNNIEIVTNNENSAGTSVTVNVYAKPKDEVDEELVIESSDDDEVLEFKPEICNQRNSNEENEADIYKNPSHSIKDMEYVTDSYLFKSDPNCISKNNSGGEYRKLDSQEFDIIMNTVRRVCKLAVGENYGAELNGEGERFVMKVYGSTEFTTRIRDIYGDIIKLLTLAPSALQTCIVISISRCLTSKGEYGYIIINGLVEEGVIDKIIRPNKNVQNGLLKTVAVSSMKVANFLLRHAAQMMFYTVTMVVLTDVAIAVYKRTCD